MEQSGCRRLMDKVAIVSGAGQWIGRSIAMRLASEGADIVVDDIIMERAVKVADEIRDLGRKALAIGADVSKMQEVEAMVKDALNELGKIDILVNNARGGGQGGRGEGAEKKSPFFYDSTEEDWDNTILWTLKVTRNCSRAVINHMIKRKSGKIINISSGAGVRGAPGLVPYSAAKAGVIGFTMALSQEVASYGIRVNCVSPGMVGSATPKSGVMAPQAIIPNNLGRLGTPEEVAALVAFLASDEADFISGQNYVMGGMNP